MIKEYRCIEKLCDSMMFIKRLAEVKLGELGVARYPDGSEAYVIVEEITPEGAWIRLLNESRRSGASECSVRFFGSGISLSLSCDMLGRAFDAMGIPVDGAAKLIPEKKTEILSDRQGRYLKSGFGGEILTGISDIDNKDGLLRGGSLSISVDGGQNYADVLLSIAKGFKNATASEEEYAVVFASVGMREDEADGFIEALGRAGISERTVSFLNYATEEGYLRAFLPYTALTCAEYLAFDHGMQVLLVMADMSCFADTCRKEKGAVADRDILSCLGTVFGSTGRRAGLSGSITSVLVATRRDDLDGICFSERVGASSDIKLEL